MTERPKKNVRKQSLYFPSGMLEEIKAEARRLDRSVAWVIQRAWRVARPGMRKIPHASPEDPDQV